MVTVLAPVSKSLTVKRFAFGGVCVVDQKCLAGIWTRGKNTAPCVEFFWALVLVGGTSKLGSLNIKELQTHNYSNSMFAKDLRGTSSSHSWD